MPPLSNYMRRNKTKTMRDLLRFWVRRQYARAQAHKVYVFIIYTQVFSLGISGLSTKSCKFEILLGYIRRNIGPISYKHCKVHTVASKEIISRRSKTPGRHIPISDFNNSYILRTSSMGIIELDLDIERK